MKSYDAMQAINDKLHVRYARSVRGFDNQLSEYTWIAKFSLCVVYLQTDKLVTIMHFNPLECKGNHSATSNII